MRFDVLEEKNNPLLKRREIVLGLDYEGGATPKKEDLIGKLAEHFKVEKEFIQIPQITSATGISKGKAFVRVWEIKPPEKKKKVKKEEAKK